MYNVLAEEVYGNSILLLENIKTVMFNFQSYRYPHHVIHYCKRCLYKYRQDMDTLVPDYYKSFHKNLDVVENNGGIFFY